jgi:hypothetical protein
VIHSTALFFTWDWFLCVLRGANSQHFVHIVFFGIVWQLVGRSSFIIDTGNGVTVPAMYDLVVHAATVSTL